MTDPEPLYNKLKVLNERLWDHRAPRPAIDQWLGNFADDFDSNPSERLHALYLLSEFIYFADREVRELLRSLYRDKYRYPIMESLRRSEGNTTDNARLQALFKKELAGTRFLGIGNPAESGTHLLYFFRQENQLPKDLFVAVPELFDRQLNDPEVVLADSAVTRIVFMDDFCGSATQALMYSRLVLTTLRDIERRVGSKLYISYLVLVGQREGLERVRHETEFDSAEAVFELDATFRSLSETSRHFENTPAGITREKARATAEKHGSRLVPRHPLGYRDGQLLLGFHHNIPDNTLPIIWYDESVTPWRPIFRRYPKLYA